MRDVYERLAYLEKIVEELNRRTFPIYDRGTWAPTYVGGTTAGVTTYTTQQGDYTRIGRIVAAKGRVTWTAATGTGQARISLPFAAAAGVNMETPAMIWTSNVTFGALTPYGLVQQGVQYLTIWTPANNAASVAIAVEAAGDVIFEAIYFV